MFLFNAYLEERNFITVNTFYFMKTIKTSAKNRVVSKSEKYSALYLKVRIEEQENRIYFERLTVTIQIKIKLVEGNLKTRIKRSTRLIPK